MAATSTGMLLVWMNVAAESEADFDAWYTREHVPERVGVPGFLNGGRYEALSGTPRFLALYDTERPEVLASAPYRERLENPTPWTQRVMPAFRDTVRVTGRVLAAQGRGTGGVVRACRIEPAPGRHDALRAALATSLPRALYERPGVARVRTVEATDSDTGGRTAEAAMRGPDRTATFALLIDGHHVAALAACADLLTDGHWAELGAQTPVEVGDYRLLYSLSR